MISKEQLPFVICLVVVLFSFLIALLAIDRKKKILKTVYCSACKQMLLSRPVYFAPLWRQLIPRSKQITNSKMKEKSMMKCPHCGYANQVDLVFGYDQF